MHTRGINKAVKTYLVAVGCALIYNHHMVTGGIEEAPAEHFHGRESKKQVTIKGFPPSEESEEEILWNH